jgi:hypothetical protein
MRPPEEEVRRELAVQWVHKAETDFEAAEPLLADLLVLERHHIERYGRPLHPRDVFEHLELVRQQSRGRIGYLVGKS